MAMSPLTPEQIEEEARKIQMVEDWPKWPVLPMKRLGLPLSDPGKLGILIHRQFTTVYVHPLGMYAIPEGPLPDVLTEENGWAKQEFDTVEAMIASGWVGD